MRCLETSSSPQRSVLLQTAFLWALFADAPGFVTSGATRLFTLITALIRNHSKGPRGQLLTLSLCTGGRDSACNKMLVTDEDIGFEQNIGLDNGQYSKQDIDVHSVFREHQVFCFPSWCPVSMKAFILRVLFQDHGDSLGDT